MLEKLRQFFTSSPEKKGKQPFDAASYCIAHWSEWRTVDREFVNNWMEGYWGKQIISRYESGLWNTTKEFLEFEEKEKNTPSS